jgi:ribosome modulation factor
MAESLTETKAERARSNLSNDVIADFMREAAATKRAVEEANSAHRTVLKRAKAAGVNQRALLEAMAAKKQDADKVVIELRDTIRYLEIAKIPISKSGLFDDLDLEPLSAEAEEADASWASEEAGYQAGIANAARDDNPFPPGQKTHGDWDAGFRRGKQFLAGQTTDSAVKPASTRRGKNRPADLH